MKMPALIRHLLGAAVVLMPLLTVLPAHSEIIATPLRGDTRLVQFPYDADNTYLVLAKPKAVTHLQFASNEQIRSVAAGDTANWELTPTKDRKHLFIKPKFEDLETSLTVLTDVRDYQFVLRSTGDGKKWYQRVSWIYGNDMLLTMEGDVPPAPAPAAEIKPAAEQGPGIPAVADVAGSPVLQAERLRFNYSVEGEAPFRPTVVFDDGKFTYFKLPPNVQELPALFAVIEDKDYSLVNFEVKGNYLVAQRLLETAVLKLGRAEVRVNHVPPAPRTFLGFKIEAN